MKKNLTINTSYPIKFYPISESKRRWNIIHGGRGSAKSRSMAQLFVVKTVSDGKTRICTRPIQKKIRDSSHKLIKWAIKSLGVEELFDIQQNYIRLKRNGAEFIFVGMHDLKSLEGAQDAWIDEAQTSNQIMIDELEPTLRENGSQLYATYNPENDDDYIHVIAKHEAFKDDRVVVEMNWRDNPWFPESLDKSRLTMLRFNKDLYNHIWEGETLKQIESAIIKAEYFNYYSELPTTIVRSVIIADTAKKAKENSDYTVYLFAGVGMDGSIYLLDLYRGKIESIEREMQAVTFWNKHRQRLGYGIGATNFDIEDAASGTDLIQRLQPRKIPVREITRKRSASGFEAKFGRLMDVFSVISGSEDESGQVFIPSNEIEYQGIPVTDAAWVDDFLYEAQRFTADDSHEYDDQVDVLIDAVAELGDDEQTWVM